MVSAGREINFMLFCYRDYLITLCIYCCCCYFLIQYYTELHLVCEFFLFYSVFSLQSKRVKVRASLGKIKWRKKNTTKAKLVYVIIWFFKYVYSKSSVSSFHFNSGFRRKKKQKNFINFYFAIRTKTTYLNATPSFSLAHSTLNENGYDVFIAFPFNIFYFVHGFIRVAWL